MQSSLEVCWDLILEEGPKIMALGFSPGAALTTAVGMTFDSPIATI
jgi:hypothetical protein